MDLQLAKHSVKCIKLVGDTKAKELKKLGIETVEDLLFHFPRRYEDRSNLKKISQLIPGEIETLHGKILGTEIVKPRPKLKVLNCYLSDGIQTISATWFNQTYLKKTLKEGSEIIVTGKVTGGLWGKQIHVKDYEIINCNEGLHTGRIVPIYPATEKISQRFIRRIIWNALKTYSGAIKEVMPEDLIKKRNLKPLGISIKNLHFPDDLKTLEKARRTLAYEELFILQVALAQIKRKFKTNKGIAHKGEKSLLQVFIKNLPFTLTAAQKRVWKEIESDMESEVPMARLVQGDVGSGKTVLAAMALLKSCSGGYQGALMAPTEILAEQHFLELKKIMSFTGIKIGLLVGSMKQAEKEKILEDVRKGKINLVIGTHTLIQEDVNFQKLGLVVIDEQHRFGVRQRSLLQQKGYNPDMLVMTATPIPRTLAITLYGDLDLSIIDEMPPGRKKVITRYVSENNRNKAYEFIKKQLSEGRQCYVVCPLIEENENLELEAAQSLADKLQNEIFKDFRVGLLHGRLKTSEKEMIMNEFRKNKINVLVSTTVVEVGVNVPNATIMVIEGSERFGLAQLHQLRGRIGRGQYQSYCVLLGNPKTDESKKRLAIMTKTTDGFEIAEEDLRIRGPGEFFGTKQHGLPELKVADLIRDQKLLQVARKDAQNFLDNKINVTTEERQRVINITKNNFKFESL